MDAWLDNLNAQAPKETLNSLRTQAEVIAAKPADAVDLCFLPADTSFRPGHRHGGLRQRRPAGGRPRPAGETGLAAPGRRRAAGGEHPEVPAEAARPGGLRAGHLHAPCSGRGCRPRSPTACATGASPASASSGDLAAHLRGGPGGEPLPPAPRPCRPRSIDPTSNPLPRWRQSHESRRAWVGMPAEMRQRPLEERKQAERQLRRQRVGIAFSLAVCAAVASGCNGGTVDRHALLRDAARLDSIACEGALSPTASAVIGRSRLRQRSGRANSRRRRRISLTRLHRATRAPNSRGGCERSRRTCGRLRRIAARSHDNPSDRRAASGSRSACADRELRVSKIFGVALGILAAIGGFVDIGDIVFNVAAGATLGYS